MIKILLAAAVAAGIYALTRPTTKKGRPDVTLPKKPEPPPTKVREPTAPEGYRGIFEDGLVDAVATCASRELPSTYDEAFSYVKSCAMDLIFPQYTWPPRPTDSGWKKNLWNDDGLRGAVVASLQADVPGP